MFDSGTIAAFQTYFVIGILIFIRVVTLFSTAPFFSHPGIPTQAKIFISAVIAIAMTMTFGKMQPTVTFELLSLVGLVFKEFFVGALLGFAASLPFYAVRVAGGILDLDLGFQTALLFDASADVPSLLGEMYFLVTLMVFLGINGHHFLLETMYVSLKAIPLTSFALTENAITIMARISTTVFILGFKLSSPVIVALILTNLGLALLGRVSPQMNIFALSYSLKIIVGLLVLMTTFALFVQMVSIMLKSFQDDIWKVVMSLQLGGSV